MTKCCFIGASAYETYGTHLYDPASGYGRGGTTEFRSSLARALPNLANGGYVIDKRPLADHPDFPSWVWRQPLCSGDIGEPLVELPNPPIGSMSYASAAYHACYWREKGARVGKREGDMIVWDDGEREEIVQRNEENYG